MIPYVLSKGRSAKCDGCDAVFTGVGGIVNWGDNVRRRIYCRDCAVEVAALGLGEDTMPPPDPPKEDKHGAE